MRWIVVSALLVAVSAGPAIAWGQLAGAGDAGRGAQTYETRCGGCHSVETDRVGPRHRGVVGRRAGSVDGYAYSDALKASRITWDAALLDRWLTDPEALVPGQRMGYRLSDAQARADVIAFLQTLNPAR